MVGTAGSTAVKSKEKLNVTHYYTQNSKTSNDNQWMSQANQGSNKFMPYSSNASSVEAIANRLI